ncbi:MAG: hypothetical protein RL088_2635 [Verrucomicrobiota bacterium]|jgi:hypothetical protein
MNLFPNFERRLKLLSATERNGYRELLAIVLDLDPAVDDDSLGDAARDAMAKLSDAPWQRSEISLPGGRWADLWKRLANAADVYVETIPTEDMIREIAQKIHGLVTLSADSLQIAKQLGIAPGCLVEGAPRPALPETEEKVRRALGIPREQWESA